MQDLKQEEAGQLREAHTQQQQELADMAAVVDSLRSELKMDLNSGADSVREECARATAQTTASLKQASAEFSASLRALEQRLQDEAREGQAGVSAELAQKAGGETVEALQVAMEELRAQQVQAAESAASSLADWTAQVEESLASKAPQQEVAELSQQLRDTETQQHTMLEQSTQDMQSTVERMSLLEEEIASVRYALRICCTERFPTHLPHGACQSAGNVCDSLIIYSSPLHSQA